MSLKPQPRDVDNRNLEINPRTKEGNMWPLYTEIKASQSPTTELYCHSCLVKKIRNVLTACGSIPPYTILTIVTVMVLLSTLATNPAFT